MLARIEGGHPRGVHRRDRRGRPAPDVERRRARMPASSAAINWAITPKRAYERNIGTTGYSRADGRINVTGPITRSGESEHRSAKHATSARTGTAASAAG